MTDILEKLEMSGVFLRPEDGHVHYRSFSSLTGEQLSYLKERKRALLHALTEPRGTRYLWRRKDPHNMAGWRVLYSRKSLGEIAGLMGADMEIKEGCPAGSVAACVPSPKTRPPSRKVSEVEDVAPEEEPPRVNRIYRYRLTDKPDILLTMLSPDDLEDAVEELSSRFGNRFIEVFERK